MEAKVVAPCRGTGFGPLKRSYTACLKPVRAVVVFDATTCGPPSCHFGGPARWSVRLSFPPPVVVRGPSLAEEDCLMPWGTSPPHGISRRRQDCSVGLAGLHLRA